MLLHSGQIKLDWNPSLRDYLLLSYPTFKMAVGFPIPMYVCTILECRSVPYTLGKGHDMGCSEKVDCLNFIENLKHAERLLNENIDLLQWDYSVSFPQVNNDTFKHGGGRLGSRNIQIACDPRGHAILKEFYVRGDGKGEVCGFRDLRVCDSVVLDDKGEIKIHRRRVKTAIVEQVAKIKSLLMGSEADQLSLIPNPTEKQMDGAQKIG